MVKILLPLICALTVILSGCTYDDETIEKAVVPQTPPGAEESIAGNFEKLARRCIMQGQTEDALTLNDLYLQSLKEDYKPYLLFQEVKYSKLHDQCMQKVAHNGHREFIDKIMTRPRRIAIVSRDFYAKNDLKNGAYWFTKLVNIQGMVRGYYTAGNIFIQKKETLPYGARLLSEAAFLGNKEAMQVLMQVNSPNNMSRQYSHQNSAKSPR